MSATKQGFVLSPCGAREVVVLARPVEEEHAAVLALLADGESWSSSGLRSCSEPASAPYSARSMACRRGQSADIRARPRAALDDAAAAWIRDDLVTPRTAAGAGLGSKE